MGRTIKVPCPEWADEGTPASEAFVLVATISREARRLWEEEVVSGHLSPSERQEIRKARNALADHRYRATFGKLPGSNRTSRLRKKRRKIVDAWLYRRMD